VLALVQERRSVASGSTPLPDGPLEVRFEAVGLVYDDDAGTTAAVDGLGLVLPAGRMLGVIGRTGSGKSSVARLLLRLVAPTAGRITIGGVDLAEADEASLRRRVAAVPQDVQLFPGTVLENVTLFSGADRAQVVAALEGVGLGDWLAGLPAGLDTVLASDTRDDGGTRIGLSSGQAQLLALSRALLRDPAVVVLDEATSRVDPTTQEAIAGAVARLVQGRTTLVIAHRLETLERCDDIAVLVDGRLAEHGPRAVLAADPDSHYARLRRAGGTAEELR
jgi:ABC-type multidrug transport system fused ATPase/permease subunit